MHRLCCPGAYIGTGTRYRGLGWALVSAPMDGRGQCGVLGPRGSFRPCRAMKRDTIFRHRFHHPSHPPRRGHAIACRGNAKELPRSTNRLESWLPGDRPNRPGWLKSRVLGPLDDTVPAM